MKISIINHSSHSLPAYQTTGSAGMDLKAWLDNSLKLKPLDRVLVPTGLFIELPDGYEAQVRPRSGLALKKGITCLNTPGTIDSDYRGEIKVLLINLSSEEQTLENGDRIAQLIIAKYEKAEWMEVDTIEVTERSAGGFGSTGNK